MSSSFENSVRYLIDGNINTVFISNTELNPYIQIDLKHSVPISGILVSHHRDHYSSFRNVRVRVGNTYIGYSSIGKIIQGNSECFYSANPPTDSSNQLLKCSNIINGRYVTIQLERTDVIYIAEIKIIIGYIGEPNPPMVVTPPPRPPPTTHVVTRPPEYIVHQCEYSKLSLNCGNLGNIQIISASYGRTDSSICVHGNVQNRNCDMNVKNTLESQYVFLCLLIYNLNIEISIDAQIAKAAPLTALQAIYLEEIPVQEHTNMFQLLTLAHN